MNYENEAIYDKIKEKTIKCDNPLPVEELKDCYDGPTKVIGERLIMGFLENDDIKVRVRFDPSPVVESRTLINPNFDDTENATNCELYGHEWDDPNDSVRVCLICNYVDYPNKQTQYLMGTPQETFFKNAWHFGLFKALHRHFERVCTRIVADDWRVHKNNSCHQRKYNFVLYTPPWYFKLYSKLERFFGDIVYPRKK